MRAAEQTAARARLPALGARLNAAAARRIVRAGERLAAADALHRAADPDRPLERGFARVHHADGRLARRAADLAAGEAVSLRFKDAARDAVVEGGAEADRPSTPPPSRARPAPRGRAPAVAAGQGDLF